MMESLGGKYEPLQRKGQTLSEIAETLNMRREAVVRALYWDVVK